MLDMGLKIAYSKLGYFMKKLKDVFEFITSSYKRSAAILFLGALTLAIPITITLVGQQQDIRQRAAGALNVNYKCSAAGTPVANLSWSPSSSQTNLWVDVGANGSVDQNIYIGSTLSSFTVGNLANSTRIDYAVIGTQFSVIVENKGGTSLDCQSSITPTSASPPSTGACDECTYEQAKVNELKCDGEKVRVCGINQSLGKYCWYIPVSCPGGQVCKTGSSGTGACVATAPTATGTQPTPTASQPAGGNDQGSTPGGETEGDTSAPGTPGGGSSPTAPTVPAVATGASVTASLPGIGRSTIPSLGINNNPKRSQRTVDVKILNSSNQQVALVKSNINYDASTGKYKGSVNLGNNFKTGTYIVKIRLDNTLWKAAAGIQNITAGQTYTIPDTIYVSGDINQDNEISLIDYNAIRSCYGTKSCSAKTGADLNDDGKVDEVDLNILFAGLAKRQGD